MENDAVKYVVPPYPLPQARLEPIPVGLGGGVSQGEVPLVGTGVLSASSLRPGVDAAAELAADVQPMSVLNGPSQTRAPAPTMNVALSRRSDVQRDPAVPCAGHHVLPASALVRPGVAGDTVADVQPMSMGGLTQAEPRVSEKRPRLYTTTMFSKFYGPFFAPRVEAMCPDLGQLKKRPAWNLLKASPAAFQWWKECEAYHRISCPSERARKALVEIMVGFLHEPLLVVLQGFVGALRRGDVLLADLSWARAARAVAAHDDPPADQRAPSSRMRTRLQAVQTAGDRTVQPGCMGAGSAVQRPSVEAVVAGVATGAAVPQVAPGAVVALVPAALAPRAAVALVPAAPVSIAGATPAPVVAGASGKLTVLEAQQIADFVSQPDVWLTFAAGDVDDNGHCAGVAAMVPGQTTVEDLSDVLDIVGSFPLFRLTDFAATPHRAALWSMVMLLSRAVLARETGVALSTVWVVTAQGKAAATFREAAQFHGVRPNVWAPRENEDLRLVLSSLLEMLRSSGTLCKVWRLPTPEWPGSVADVVEGSMTESRNRDACQRWQYSEFGFCCIPPSGTVPTEARVYLVPPHWSSGMRNTALRWRAFVEPFAKGLRTPALEREPAVETEGFRSVMNGLADVQQLLQVKLQQPPVEPLPTQRATTHASLAAFQEVLDGLPPVQSAGDLQLAQTPWRYPMFAAFEMEDLVRVPLCVWDVELGKPTRPIYAVLNRMFRAMADDLAVGSAQVRHGVHVFVHLLPALIAGGSKAPKAAAVCASVHRIFLDPLVLTTKKAREVKRSYADVESRIRTMLQLRVRQVAAAALPSSPSVPHSSAVAMQRTENRARHLFKDGHASKAAKAILGLVGVAKVSDQVTEAMGPLFPVECPVPSALFDATTAPPSPPVVTAALAPLLGAGEIFLAQGEEACPELEVAPRLTAVYRAVLPMLRNLVECLHHIRKDTTTGLSGMSARWLHGMVPKGVAQQPLEEGLAGVPGGALFLLVLLARLYSGALGAAGREHLTAARLLPLEKKSAGGAATGVQLSPREWKDFHASYHQPTGAQTDVPVPPPKYRPICCMEVSRRLADAGMTRALRPTVTRELAPLQLGIAPGGIENVVHALQYEVAQATAPSSAPLFVCALDLKNAFNSCSRAGLVEIFRAIAPGALPYLRMVLGRPSQAIMAHRKAAVGLSVTCGLPQGSPIASLGFALLTLAPLVLTQHCFTDVGVVAAHDDVYLVAHELNRLQDALRTMTACFARYGLLLNTRKTVLYSPNRDVSRDDVPEFWRQFNRLDPRVGLSVLGVPVGNAAFVRTEMAGIVQQIIDRWKTMASRMRDRRFFATLTRAVNRHGPMYYLRTVSPVASAETLGQLDAAVRGVLDFLTERDGASLDLAALPAMCDQASLPIRMGGAGLWRYGSFHHFAWVDSHMSAFAFASKVGTAPVVFLPTVRQEGSEVCVFQSWFAATLRRFQDHTQYAARSLRDATEPLSPMAALQPHERPMELAAAIRSILAADGTGARTVAAHARQTRRFPGLLDPLDMRVGDGGVSALVQMRYVNVRLQRMWTQAHRQAQHDLWSSRDYFGGGWDDMQRSVLQHATQLGSAACLTHNPADAQLPQDLPESNRVFALCLRARLGAPMHNLCTQGGEALRCRTCQVHAPGKEPMDKWGLHGLFCAGKGWRIFKHDFLMQLVEAMCSQLGLKCKFEPRLDAFKFTVADPAQPVPAASHPPLSAAAPAVAPLSVPALAGPSAAVVAQSLDLTSKRSNMPPSSGLCGQPVTPTRQHAACAMEMGGASDGAAPQLPLPRSSCGQRRGDLYIWDPPASGTDKEKRQRLGQHLSRTARRHLDTLVLQRRYGDKESAARSVERARWMVDGRVTFAHARNVRQRSPWDGQAAVKHGEKMKLRQYSKEKLGFDLQDDCGVTFVPFCMTNLGVWGPRALQFLESLSRDRRRSHGQAAADGWKRYWRRFISFRLATKAMQQYLRWERAQTKPGGAGSQRADPGASREAPLTVRGRA